MSEPPPEGIGTPLVEIVFEDARWEAADLAAIVDRAAQVLLAELGIVAEDCEISLLATDDTRIASLNAGFRGREGPTNVLSWPAFEADSPGILPEAEERPVFLGDIALAYDTCAREAEAGGISFGDHVLHLCIHGILHLLGFDHEVDSDAETMEAIEVKALASLGIADPYWG